MVNHWSPDLPVRPLAVVPVGSVEQHGAHLPLTTDTTVAATVAARVVERLGGGVVLLPPVAYGASGEHEEFPGTVSIGTDALSGMVVELGRSAMRWAGRLLLVNGHGGNLDALRAAVPLLRSEGRDVAWFPCAVPGGDSHAGRAETSMMLHAAPDGVRADRAEAGTTDPIAELLPRLRRDGVAGVSPNGVLGDPAGSNAQEGARSFAFLVDQLAAAVLDWQIDRRGRLQAAGGPGSRH